MRLARIEQQAAKALGVPLVIHKAVAAISLLDLDRAERRRMRRFRYTQRRRDWAIGRKALKELLRTLNRAPDTMSLGFPNPQLSLSHGNETAYAVGTTAALQGIGIDYERLKAVKANIADWFLNAAEMRWLNDQCPDDFPQHVIRLWTIKEAAFKSHPHNNGMVLRDFSIVNLAAAPCATVTTMHNDDIQVASLRCDRGYLSIAICRKSS